MTANVTTLPTDNAYVGSNLHVAEELRQLAHKIEAETDNDLMALGVVTLRRVTGVNTRWINPEALYNLHTVGILFQAAMRQTE